jgi:hypothetical protein
MGASTSTALDTLSTDTAGAEGFTYDVTDAIAAYCTSSSSSVTLLSLLEGTCITLGDIGEPFIVAHFSGGWLAIDRAITARGRPAGSRHSKLTIISLNTQGSSTPRQAEVSRLLAASPGATVLLAQETHGGTRSFTAEGFTGYRTLGTTRAGGTMVFIPSSALSCSFTATWRPTSRKSGDDNPAVYITGAKIINIDGIPEVMFMSIYIRPVLSKDSDYWAAVEHILRIAARESHTSCTVWIGGDWNCNERRRHQLINKVQSTLDLRYLPTDSTRKGYAHQGDTSPDLIFTTCQQQVTTTTSSPTGSDHRAITATCHAPLWPKRPQRSTPAVDVTTLRFISEPTRKKVRALIKPTVMGGLTTITSTTPDRASAIAKALLSGTKMVTRVALPNTPPTPRSRTPFKRRWPVWSSRAMRIRAKTMGCLAAIADAVCPGWRVHGCVHHRSTHSDLIRRANSAEARYNEAFDTARAAHLDVIGHSKHPEDRRQTRWEHAVPSKKSRPIITSAASPTEAVLGLRAMYENYTPSAEEQRRIGEMSTFASSDGNNDSEPFLFGGGTPFTSDDVMTVIKEMRRDASQGIDGVSWSTLSIAPWALLVSIADTANIIIAGAYWPFKLSSVTSIPKSTPGQFRNICTGSGIGKVIERMIMQRTMDTIDPTFAFGPFQTGFVPRSGPVEPEFTSQYVTDYMRANNRAMSTVRFDAVAAYDRVTFISVLEGARDVGATPRDIRFLADYLGLDLGLGGPPVLPQLLFNPLLPDTTVTRRRGISTGAPGAPMMFNLASRRIGTHVTPSDGIIIPPPVPRPTVTPLPTPTEGPLTEDGVGALPPTRPLSDKITSIEDLETADGSLVWVAVRYADDSQRFSSGTPHSVLMTQCAPGGGDDELQRIGLNNGHAKTTINVSNQDLGTHMPSYGIPGRKSIACSENNTSLGFTITTHGITPGNTHLFRGDVWAHASFLQSPHIHVSEKVMALTNILLPRHMYRYMASPSLACHAVLESTYNFAVRLIAHTPRWVDTTPARTILGIPSFRFLFNKMRMLHTLYTVRSPYARMGEISMRCLFYHWMHGNKGNGTHTDQILSLVEHLDPDGPASAAARASATPSPFMQMFIGDGFEKLNDKTKSKPDAKTVVMSRLHLVDGRARADESTKGFSHKDLTTMLSLVLNAFPASPTESVGSTGSRFGPGLCPFCGADIDVPSHAVVCIRARPLIVDRIKDPYNNYILDTAVLDSPLSGIPILGSDAILDVSDAVAAARAVATASLSSARLPFPGSRGAQRMIDVTRIGSNIDIGEAVSQQGWRISDPCLTAPSVSNADCVFAAVALIANIPPGSISRWSSALRQSCASLLATQPSITSGPDAHHFPLNTRRAELSNALHHAAQLSDPELGAGVSGVVVIGHLFGVKIQVITVPRRGGRPSSTVVPNIAGAALAGSIIINVADNHASAAIPVDASVHGPGPPRRLHHQPEQPKHSARAEGDRVAARATFWESIRQLQSRPAASTAADRPPLGDFVRFASGSTTTAPATRAPAPAPVTTGSAADANGKGAVPPLDPTPAPPRGTARNTKWALVPAQDIGTARSGSGSARISVLPSETTPARTPYGSVRVAFPPSMPTNK